MHQATIGPWTAKWYGGRLADIYYGGSGDAVECVEIGEYDHSLTHDELAASREGLGQRDVRAALAEWVEEQGECYIENVVRYR